MADIGLFPSLQDFVDANRPAPEDIPAPARGMVAPQPSGTGSLIPSALGSGYHGAIADVGQGVQAVATALGDKRTADNAAAFAQTHRAAAATYATEENENASLFSPRGLAYRVLQGVPAVGAGLVAALGGEAVAGGAGAALAGGLVGLPGAVGGNVNRTETENGPLDRGAALKAIGLGVPEAALGAVPLERAVGGLAAKAGESYATTAVKQAATQAAASAGQDFIAQQMGDPDRPIAARANEMIQAALTGGVTGGIVGTGVHAIAKARPAAVTTDQLTTAIDQTLAGAPRAEPAPPPAPTVPEPDERQSFTPSDLAQQGRGQPEDTREVSTPSQRKGVWEAIRAQREAEIVEAQKQKEYWGGQAYPPETVNPEVDNSQPPVNTEVDNRKVFTPSDLAQQGRGQPEDTREVSTPSQRRDEQVAAQKQKDYWNGQAYTTAPESVAVDNISSVIPRDPASDGVEAQRARIRAGEQIEPIQVQPDQSNPGHFMVVDGEHRLEAHKQEGLTHILAQTDGTPDAEHLQAMSAVNGKVPEFMKDATTIEDAQSAIRTRWDQSGPNKITRELAGRFGMLDDAGGLTRDTPAPVDTQSRIHDDYTQPRIAPKLDVPKATADLQTAVQAAKKSIVDMSKMKAPDTGSDVHDKHVQQEWDAGIQTQAAKLKQIDAAIKSGNTAALAGLQDHHFENDEFWNNEKLGDKQVDALDAHANLEQNVLEAARRAFPQQKRVGSVVSSLEPPPPSAPRDLDTYQIVQNGGSLKDILQHYSQNGSNGFVKTLSNLLLQHGVDAPVQFGIPPARNSLNLRAGTREEASYTADGRIQLHQNSDLERLVMHEGVHAATFNAIEQRGPLYQKLNDLLGQVQRRSPGNLANGLSNVHEFVTEAFSNPKFQEFLDSMPADYSTNNGKVASIWRSFKNAVGSIFGATPSHQTMLDRVLDIGHQTMEQNAAAKPATGRVYSLYTPDEAEARVSGYLKTMDRIKPLVSGELADEAAGKLTNFTTAARGLAQGWTSPRELAEMYGKFSTGMTDWIHHSDRKTLLSEISSKVGAVATAKNRALTKAESKAVGELVTGTHIGLNASKPWAEVIRDNPDLNTPAMEQEHRRLAAISTNMTPKGKDAYQTMVATNEARIRQNYTTQLYNMVKGMYGDKLTAPADPTEAHRFDATLHDDAGVNRDYWTKSFATMREPVEQYINEQTALSALKKNPAIAEAVAPLKSLLGEYDGLVTAMRQVPNFHMGREGGFYAAGSIALGDNAKPNPQSIAAIQKALNDKGFGHVELSQHLDSPKVYARVETPGDSERLAQVFRDMQAKGHMTPDTVSNGSVDQIVTNKGIMPLWREKMIGVMEAQLKGLGDDTDPVAQAQLAQRVGDMKREFLNSLPDSSVNKVMARRAGIQGFSGDWAKSFKDRDNNTSRMVANMAAMPDISASALQMRKDVQAMNRRGDVTTGQKIALSQAAQELTRRELSSPTGQPNSFISAVNSLSHTFELGFSVPYAMMLMSQNATLTLPRLGSEEGFLRSAQSMGRQTLKSMKIIGAAMKGQDWATFGLRQSELEKAGISKADVDFIMHQQAMGTFNHGGYTNAMTGHSADAEGSLNAVRRMANSTTLYSEMQPRVLAALAARDLYTSSSKNRSEPMHDFVYRMVRDSQLPWDSLSTPRQLTAAGTSGQLSPLINKFMGYQTRVSSLMVRELANAFGRNGPEAASAARKFLGGHMAAVTVLAGTLGAPMAGVAASVFDRLADWSTGKDDWDVTASYRNFLADTFGKQAGEVVARGVPRMFGVDFSHMGDEKLLPGSSAALFMTEKRKLEDAEKDWLKSEAGAPAGMMMNFVLGARDLANGDYLRGAQKMVPEAFRGPAEAAQLGLYGYRGKDGSKLPITAGAKDIALTAAGLEPAKEAEYGEAQRTISGESTLAQLRESNITQHMSQALSRGDNDNFQYWLGQSQDYQQDHPGMRPPAMELQRYMQMHQRQAAFAEATGSPLGAKPRNLTGRGMVGYANLQE